MARSTYRDSPDDSRTGVNGRRFLNRLEVGNYASPTPFSANATTERAKNFVVRFQDEIDLYRRVSAHLSLSVGKTAPWSRHFPLALQYLAKMLGRRVLKVRLLIPILRSPPHQAEHRFLEPSPAAVQHCGPRGRRHCRSHTIPGTLIFRPSFRCCAIRCGASSTGS